MKSRAAALRITKPPPKLLRIIGENVGVSTGGVTSALLLPNYLKDDPAARHFFPFLNNCTLEIEACPPFSAQFPNV